MERDLKFYRGIAKKFRKMVENKTEATAVKVVPTESGVDILPAKTNSTGTFYYTEDMVDFCRVFHLSNYVSMDDGKVVAHIY